jgi:hypothetical protein
LALLKQAAALHEQAYSLEALAELAKATEPDTNELLTEKKAFERYGMARAALDARKIPKAKVGRAWKWRVSDIEVAIQAKPSTPRDRKVEAPAENIDPLDQMLARGELRKVGNRR